MRMYSKEFLNPFWVEHSGAGRGGITEQMHYREDSIRVDEHAGGN